MAERMTNDTENGSETLQDKTVFASDALPKSARQPEESSHFQAHDKRKRGFLSIALLVIASLGAGFFGGWLGNQREDTVSVQRQEVVLKSQAQLISNIAKEVGPSVVSIEVTTQSASGFRNLFGLPSAPSESQGAGTGIIIDKSGLIVTNRHVVPAGTTKVSITLADGTSFEDVEVLGRTAASDPLDVAFLRIVDTKGKSLSVAQIGDSSQVRVGDGVVAIGNALGQFQNTVTSGIISGHGRNVQASSGGANLENLQNLFQTDAAINQGNSGGPLVGLDGKVIGINTAVASGDAQNVGFAIPINDVKGLIESVMRTGKLERPYLGLVYIPVTADMAAQYDLDRDKGAYVPPSMLIGQDAVIEGSPADKAGIQEGDILVKVGDTAIDENHSLNSILGKYKPGDKVSIMLVRDKAEKKVEATLIAAPQE